MFYYLYFFIDIYSRKIVGFDVYESERAECAEQVIQAACEAEKIKRKQIILHSDNGSPMKASTFLVTLHILGITPTYSRPSVSNDNPYSEALFKATKYCRWYPEQSFGTLIEAREWAKKFVNWYSYEHFHSGLKFITSHARHEGLDNIIMQQRKNVYEEARNKNPSRWINKSRSWLLPKEVYLNP